MGFDLRYKNWTWTVRKRLQCYTIRTRHTYQAPVANGLHCLVKNSQMADQLPLGEVNDILLVKKAAH